MYVVLIFLGRKTKKRHIFFQREEINRCCGPRRAQDWPRYPHVLWSETSPGLAKRSNVLWSETGSGLAKRSTGAVVQNRSRTGQDIHMYCGPKRAQDWPRDPQVLWSKTGPGLGKISTCTLVRNGIRIGQGIHRCCGPKQIQDWLRDSYELWTENGPRNCSRHSSHFFSTELTRQVHCTPL